MKREERIAWLKALMTKINANHGTINCAHVALRLDEILDNPESAATVSPVPITSGELFVQPKYTTDGAGIIKSFCADSRILARCMPTIYLDEGLITDITGDKAVILVDEQAKVDDASKIKLVRCTRANALEMLSGLTMRDKDGTAKGFIIYTYHGKSSGYIGHIANFFVDEKDEVYFLDAQKNKNPETFVLDQPPRGFREDFFFVQCAPQAGIRLAPRKKPLKPENNKMPGVHNIDSPTVEDMKSLSPDVHTLITKEISRQVALAIPIHVRKLQVDSIDALVAYYLPKHINSLSCIDISPTALQSLSKNVEMLVAVNIDKNSIKFMPSTIRRFQTNKITLEIVQALPLSLRNLTCTEIDVDAVKALSRFSLLHFQCDKISVEATKALPPNIRFVMHNISLDIMQVLPAHVDYLVAYATSVAVLKKLSPHVRVLCCQLTPEQEKECVEYFKLTRASGFILFNYGNPVLYMELSPAANFPPVPNPLQPAVSQHLAPPPPPANLIPLVPNPLQPATSQYLAPSLTPSLNALREENTNLRQRLHDSERLTDAQTAVIKGLREELKRHEDARQDGKRARMG